LRTTIGPSQSSNNTANYDLIVDPAEPYCFRRSHKRYGSGRPARCITRHATRDAWYSMNDYCYSRKAIRSLDIAHTYRIVHRASCSSHSRRLRST